MKKPRISDSFNNYQFLMRKNNIYLGLIGIICLAVIGAVFIFPGYFNKAIDYFENKVELGIPKIPETPFKLGLDLKGGSHLVYEADLKNISKGEEKNALDGLRDVIERRVNVFGIVEPVVATQQVGSHFRLFVDLPGVENVEKAIEMIGKTPLLEFKEQRDQAETEAILAKQKELEGKSQEEYGQIENWQLAFEDPYFKPTELRGQYLKAASLDFDKTTFTPLVSMEFNEEGAKIFQEITSENIGKVLAIYIDDIPISTPVVREEISGGKAQITGQFTVEEAKELARNLNAGALPVPISLISQTVIGPTLGAASLQKSLTAGLVGFLAVILFMILFYRLSGVFASLALTIFVLILLSLFKLIPITLSLAGIGGLVLSIGMAVDANVLIFERMKEERKAEEDFSRAVAAGFSRAWPSIRDSNFTTLLVAVIMFGFGSSFVRGFAVTLSLGILTSMFSALFITRIFIEMVVGTRLEKIKWLWR